MLEWLLLQRGWLASSFASKVGRPHGVRMAIVVCGRQGLSGTQSGLQVVEQGVFGFGSSVEVALDCVASPVCELGGLGGGFDALGDDLQAERGADGEDTADHGGAGRVGGYAADERSAPSTKPPARAYSDATFSLNIGIAKIPPRRDRLAAAGVISSAAGHGPAPITQPLLMLQLPERRM